MKTFWNNGWKDINDLLNNFYNINENINIIAVNKEFNIYKNYSAVVLFKDDYGIGVVFRDVYVSYNNQANFIAYYYNKEYIIKLINENYFADFNKNELIEVINILL